MNLQSIVITNCIGIILLLATDREEEILQIEAQIRESAEKFNKSSGRPCQISLSMGHAVYRQRTSDNFLEAIDHAMYLDKQQRHASGTLSERRHRSVAPSEGGYHELTGLPNPAYFFRIYEARNNLFRGEGNHCVLLYMDLDGMKAFNHRNSFAEGDKLLKAFANLLRRTFGNEDCCHISADRFAALAVDSGLDTRLKTFTEEARLINGGKSLPVRIGMYSSDLEDVPVSTTYDRAKLACDTLPDSDVSGFCYYRTEMLEAIKKRRYIQENLDRAIFEKWILVYYQPIVRAVNEKICDMEALARWDDPRMGFMPPSDFIPYLEASGSVY